MKYYPISRSQKTSNHEDARSCFWPGLRAALLCMMVSGIGLGIVHTLSDRALMAGMREHLGDIAATTAGRIDAQEHQGLALMSELVPGSPEYESASQPLLKLRNEVPDIYYAYTLIMDDGVPTFLLDSSYYYKNQGDEAAIAMPGEIYEDAPQELLDAWKSGKAVVSHEPYTDKWGTFISAFAPFRNGQGELAGLVGVDISMDQLAQRRRPVHMALSVAAAGCFLGSLIVGLLRWLTERRLHEREADLLKAKAKALSAERAARAGEQAKSTFLATMSHEIRTPLNGVLGMAEILAGTQLDEAQREQVKAIRHSGRLLLVMLNDILDFSKIDAGALAVHTETIGLKALLRDTLGLYSGSAESKGLKLEIEHQADAPECIQADPNRAAQVLGNLLSNAIKFTEAGSVRIVVGLDPERPGMARISVEDTGIGIPEEKVKDLFVPFSQLDSSLSRSAGGTGLGLVISRHLAELMGGSIHAASRAGKGSVFHVFLPIAEPGSEPQAKIENLAVAADIPQGLKVLVAEDVAVNRRVMELMLKRLGIEPDFAENGREALSLWRKHGHDLILMDIQMPELDGLQATRQIRQESKDSQRPWIIALTGGVMDDDQARAAMSGMNGFIAKPIDLAGLGRGIANVPNS